MKINRVAFTIQKLWSDHRLKLLWFLVAIMTLAAVLRLSHELPRLVWLQGSNPAIDLEQRYNEVQLWFAGEHIYSQLEVGGVYPPASHAILWPFLSYSSWTLVRWIWAISSIVGLGWFIHLFLKASKTERVIEKIFISLLCLASYATNVTIGNGQLTIHVLAPLLAGLLLLDKKDGWNDDILASLLFVFTLVKPTLSAPFFWIVLFRPGRLRPVMIVLLSYTAFALIAVAFQQSSFVTLHLDWLARSNTGIDEGSLGTGDGFAGYGDIHNLMGNLGLRQFNSLASILILLALGYWTYVNRFVNLWLLLGVTGIVTRMFAYHRVYDDMLILLPILALFRLSQQSQISDAIKVWSGSLMAIATMASFVPASLRLLSPPWNRLFTVGQPCLWIILLIFLLYQAREARRIQTPS